MLFDEPEVAQAIVPGATLPSKDDALAFRIVVQQLGVGHGVLPFGTELPIHCVNYGE